MYLLFVNGNPKDNTLNTFYLLEVKWTTVMQDIATKLKYAGKGQTHISFYNPSIDMQYVNHDVILNMTVKQLIAEFSSNSIYPVFLFISNSYILEPLMPITTPRLKNVELNDTVSKWLIFGVGHEDYQPWIDYLNKLSEDKSESKIILYSFANINYQDVIPEDTFIDGDFNNLGDLDRLPNNSYDRILFARGTVKSVKWIGQHLYILSKKLTRDGKLLIPNARAELGDPFRKWTNITEVLRDIDNKRKIDDNVSDAYKIIYENEVYKSDNVQFDQLSLLISAYAPRIIWNSFDMQNPIEITTKKIRDQAIEFYNQENKLLLDSYFDTVNLIENNDKYPNPPNMTQHVGLGFWELSASKHR